LFSLVVYEGTVYRTRATVDNCQATPGVPAAFDPVINGLVLVNGLVTGPLAPIIVVGGGLILSEGIFASHSSRKPRLSTIFRPRRPSLVHVLLSDSITLAAWAGRKRQYRAI
jgi:hypothetical protein